MNVILSLNPKYFERIANGEKEIEFRKMIFNKNVSEIWIYVTSPVKKLVGKFCPGHISSGSPVFLWRLFKDKAGLTKEEFFSYFQGTEKGYAIEIKNLELFDTPIAPQKLIPNFIPPRNFVYFDLKNPHRLHSLDSNTD